MAPSYSVNTPILIDLSKSVVSKAELRAELRAGPRAGLRRGLRCGLQLAEALRYCHDEALTRVATVGCPALADGRGASAL